MSFAAALLYFLTEATKGLVRNWKVSLIAVTAISASLALAAAFWLFCSNAASLLDTWRAESRITVYFTREASPEEVEGLAAEVAALPSVAEVLKVDPATASARMRATFPSFSGLFSEESSQLPWSLELRTEGEPRPELRQFLEATSSSGKVLLVDDDGDWLHQLETLLLIVSSSALVLGGLIGLTTLLTISSVVRLTALLHNDEIAVLRLVGATEFFIRGPFYFAGLLQGLLGGLMAVVWLLLLRLFVLETLANEAPFLGLLLAEPLTLGQYSAVVGLSSLSGLLGAIVSLRREESLSWDADTPNWQE